MQVKCFLHFFYADILLTFVFLLFCPCSPAFFQSYFCRLVVVYFRLPWWLSVKNLPVSAGDVGQEDPLEKEMATYSSILAWEILQTDRGAWQDIIHGVAKELYTT